MPWPRPFPAFPALPAIPAFPALLAACLLAACLGPKLALAAAAPAVAAGTGPAPEAAPPREPVRPLEFSSPEHAFLGSRVVLQLPGGRSAGGDSVVLLRTRSSEGTELALSYAELLYLAGDFYGVPYARVGDGKPFDSAWSERSEAASVAFRRDLLSLSYQGHVDDLPRLRELEQGLMQRFQQAREQGRPLPTDHEDDCAFMLATGAEACIRSAYDLMHLYDYLGRYFDLASRSQDHFGDNAQSAFLVGQRLALQQALHARGEEDLLRAYLTAAFAAHFGSDAFAAGHVRTDKQAIDEYCSTRFGEAPLGGYTAQVLSGVLVKTMHDRENRDGIVLVGRDGRRWTAHGDNYLSLPGGEAEMQPIVRSLQLAADQVFEAYGQRGRADEASYVEDRIAALRLTLPDVAATRDAASGNPPALFEARDGSVIWNDPERTSLPLNCDTALWRYAPDLARAAAAAASAPAAASASAFASVPAASDTAGRGAAAGKAPGAAGEAARSIDVTVRLESPAGAAAAAPRRLSCDWGRIDHGDFPATDGHFSQQISAHLESNGGGTGAEGDLYCLVSTPDLREVACQFAVHYDNPYWGSDSQTLRRSAGACTVELDDAGRGNHWHPRVVVR